MHTVWFCCPRTTRAVLDGYKCESCKNSTPYVKSVIPFKQVRVEKHFISLCLGGSKVPVVTVYALQHRALSGGHVYPFDVWYTGHHKCLKGSCHSIQEVPSYINRSGRLTFSQVSELSLSSYLWLRWVQLKLILEEGGCSRIFRTHLIFIFCSTIMPSPPCLEDFHCLVRILFRIYGKIWLLSPPRYLLTASLWL